MASASSAATASPRTPRERRIDWTRVFGYDVFISYSRRDAAHYATSLELELSRLDLQCFRDDTNLPPGSPLNATLSGAISRSRVMVIIVSELALQSEFVEHELELAIASELDIIPINVDHSITQSQRPSKVRELLREHDLTWVDDPAADLSAHTVSRSTLDAVRRRLGWRRANRWRRAATAAIFLVLLATACAATLQWRSALEQYRRARGRELLLQGDALLRSEPDQVAVAALLGLESQIRSPSEAALQSLRDKLETLTVKRSWRTDTNGVEALVRVQSAGELATIVRPNGVEVRNLSTGEVVRQWAFAEEVVTGWQKTDDEFDDPVGATNRSRLYAAVTDDGRVLAYATSTHGIVLFDLQAGTTLGRIPYDGGIADIDVAGDTVAAITIVGCPGGETGGDNAPEVECRPSYTAQAWAFRPAVRQVYRGDSEKPDFQSLARFEAHLSLDGRKLCLINRLYSGASAAWPEWLVADLGSRKARTEQYSSEMDMGAAVFDATNGIFYGLGSRNVVIASKGKGAENRSAKRLAVSANGRYLAGDGVEGIRIWRQTGDALEVFALLHADSIGGEKLLDLQDDGGERPACLLATGSPHNVVTVRDCAGGVALARIPLTGEIRGVRVLPERRAVLVQTDHTIEMFPVNPGHTTFDNGSDANGSVAIANGRAVVCSEGDEMRLWSLSTGRLLRLTTLGPLAEKAEKLFDLPYAFQWCEMMSDGSAAFFEAFAGHGAFVSGTIDFSHTPPYDRLVGSTATPPAHTASSVATVAESGVLSGLPAFAWPFEGTPVTPQHDAEPLWISPVQVRDGEELSANAEGTQVAIAGPQKVRVFDTATFRILAEWAHGMEGVTTRIAHGSLILSNKSAAGIWSLQGEFRGRVALQSEDSRLCDVSPDAKFVVVCRGSGIGEARQKSLYHLATGALAGRWEIKSSDTNVYDSEPSMDPTGFSPNGRYWATVAGGKLVAIDLGTRKTLFSVPSAEDAPLVLGADFVAMAGDREIQVYALPSGRIVDAIAAPAATLGFLLESGDTMVAWGANWMMRHRIVRDAPAVLCGGLQRQLSREDWQRYFPGEPFRNTCDAYAAGKSWWQRLLFR